MPRPPPTRDLFRLRALVRIRLVHKLARRPDEEGDGKGFHQILRDDDAHFAALPPIARGDRPHRRPRTGRAVNPNDDASSDRILGITVPGAEASELMAVVQTAMLAELPYTALRDAIFTHPTAAEGLSVLFGSESGKVKAADQPFHNEWTQKYVVRDNQITEMAEYNIQVEPRG